MKLFSRRHRGSQAEDSTPTSGAGSLVTENGNVDWYPGNGWSDAPPPLPSSQRPISRRPTARQVLTSSLWRHGNFAEDPDEVERLADAILLDLDEAGLEVVAKDDVE
ncbi:hypothetical protein AB0395_39550 [Streptosporangium sp. NPDC051023]|uniref:hypothetical protein n=1 Tax=Streptosporangium sp. NPDC051023 TaxID=3155410 RepID=UPI00344E08B9